MISNPKLTDFDQNASINSTVSKSFISIPNN